LEGQIQEQIICAPIEKDNRIRYENSLADFVSQYCWMADPEQNMTTTKNCSAGRKLKIK